jgi:hypothetical protein
LQILDALCPGAPRAAPISRMPCARLAVVGAGVTLAHLGDVSDIIHHWL